MSEEIDLAAVAEEMLQELEKCVCRALDFVKRMMRNRI